MARDRVKNLIERFIGLLDRTRQEAVDELHELTPVETSDEAQAAFRRASAEFAAVRVCRHCGRGFDPVAVSKPCPKSLTGHDWT